MKNKNIWNLIQMLGHNTSLIYLILNSLRIDGEKTISITMLELSCSSSLLTTEIIHALLALEMAGVIKTKPNLEEIDWYSSIEISFKI